MQNGFIARSMLRVEKPLQEKMCKSFTFAMSMYAKENQAFRKYPAIHQLESLMVLI